MFPGAVIAENRRLSLSPIQERMDILDDSVKLKLLATYQLNPS